MKKIFISLQHIDKKRVINIIMAENMYTFSMIKPEAVQNNLTGKILSEIESNGFKIAKLREISMSYEQAQGFYESLREMPFYKDLCAYMSSGSVIAMVLEKENAVKDFRELIGATNPAEARIGTIRRKYGHSKSQNAIHGSDSDESAERECRFFDL